MSVLPPLRTLAREALPRLFEGTVAPAGLFYGGYVLKGLWLGLLAAFLWSYATVGVRMLRRRPVSGLIILSLVALTGRSVAAFMTHSVFVYFLQPTVGTLLMAGAFLASAIAGRPLTERLARDVVSLPAAVRDHPAVRRLHVRLSVAWGATFLVNGALALWLLLNHSVGTFLLAKHLAGAVLTVAAVAGSVIAFRRCMANHRVAQEAA